MMQLLLLNIQGLLLVISIVSLVIIFVLRFKKRSKYEQLVIEHYGPLPDDSGVPTVPTVEPEIDPSSNV